MLNDHENHIPVLAEACIEALAIDAEGTYVDATFGRGGHSRLILDALGKGRLVAFDQDQSAITHGQSVFGNEERLTLVHERFSKMAKVVEQLGLLGKIDGVLMDIGVSSPQLDEADRGFSFMRDGPLDMRMDQTKGISAYDYLLRVREDELADILYLYGEERSSRRIAKAIVEARKQSHLKDSTKSLVDIIMGSGIRYDKLKHPATRSFQAIRMVVNQEVEELEKGLEAALACLKVGGRLAVMSFHGVEHRIVKQFVRKHKQDKKLRFLEKVGVGFQERKKNPRARSAYLRVMEKTE